MYCRVIPFQRTFDTYWLVYFVPEHILEDLKLYQVIEVPLKNSIEIGIILDIFENTPTWLNSEKIKSIIAIKDETIFLYPYQAKLIDFIANTYITPAHNALWVFFPRNLRGKIQKETLEKVQPKIYEYPYKNTHTLSVNQAKSFESIVNSDNKKILFYGVTGSGKTEVYRELIKKNLDTWKQTLLLIPEIILGNQIGERMQKVFWEDILVISSTVTEAKKTQYWVDIKSWNAKIIIGTRSALFYPYSNLGMVIVDEEHDQSYVSDSAPRYSSIDIVSEISNTLDIPIILASGTPSVTSMYKAMKGEYQLVNLLEKYVG